VDVMDVNVENPTLVLSGEMDLATVDAIYAALSPWIDRGGPGVVDVSQVSFMDASGVRMFCRAARDLGARGCVIIHGATGLVRKVFEITHVEDAITNLHVIPCSVLARAA
jgi:anti-anti-sigma factor